MSTKLLIVESPSKAKTIQKYLGSDFIVTSSVGHIRDIPKSNKTAIDIEAGFVPNYEISAGKTKVVAELRKLAAKSDEILLATDPDREGEAIAWHIGEIIKEDPKLAKKPMHRVSYSEITETAIREALQHPRDVDQNLRKAQEARRILDRLVGYDLSGLIWKKVRYGLSAGRVQSPALRIIMEKEREIRAFIPETFFVLEGAFKKGREKFDLVCDTEPGTRKEAERIESVGTSNDWTVATIKKTDAKRSPKAPFTTSTLQQAGSTYLGMSPSNTMRAAQKLYEAGHITYMRTDSPNLSKDATTAIAKLVEKSYGKEYVEIKAYKSKSKNAQEAHEAIRPTKISASKQKGATAEQKALYQMIWERTVASQMAPAKIERTKVSANVLDSKDEPIPNFSINGSRLVFPGWLEVDTRSRGEDKEVPLLAEGDTIKCAAINIEEKQTQPPGRYTEAGLVKELEKRGIGRPSTYASIMQTLQNRGYVNKEGRTLFPTDTGDVVSTFLEEHFENYISDTFTAEMEDELDEIADGSREYAKTLKDFYTPFQKAVTAKEDIPKLTNLGDADPKFKCPKCSKSMVIKLGRSGKFLSCSNYPDCDGALTEKGKSVDEGESLGAHPESGDQIYAMTGRFGPYVQLGKKTEENPKPRRASLPKGIEDEDITLDLAVRLLILPRELGTHPESGDEVIANIGRFGPYVGHGREFRSLKKSSGLDPYTITFDEAIAVLNAPKQLPKGVTLVKELGKHPKTGKDLAIYESKSGKFLRKGLKRIYLPDDVDVENFGVEDAVVRMSVE